MIVTHFYYGNLPVKRVCLNDKIIWDTVDARGFSVSTSYAKSQAYGIVLLPLDGAVEASIDVIATGYAFDALLIDGDAYNASYGSAIGHARIISELDGKSESRHYAVSVVDLLNTALMSARTKLESDTTGVCYAAIAPLAIVKEVNKMYAQATALAAKGALLHANDMNYNAAKAYIEMAIQKVMHVCAATKFDALANVGSYFEQTINGLMNINTHTSALLSSNDAVLLEGLVDSDTYALAIGQTLPLTSLSGLNMVETYSNVIARLIDPMLLSSIGETVTFTEANGVPGIAANAFSNEENELNANAILNVWYPAYGHDGILDIRQAFDINIENDILEVI